MSRPSLDFVLAGFLAGVLLLALAPAVAAQCPRGAAWELAVPPEGVIQEITLDAGIRYQGRVVDAGDPVAFELVSGDVLRIAPDRVRCLRPVTGSLHEGQFRPSDPNTTRLFFAPTGRAVAAGSGYFGMFGYIMPMVAVGVTDRVTLAAGTPLIITEQGPEVFWLAPKVEVARTAGFRGSVGVLSVLMPREGEHVGVLYGVGTIGPDPDQALTLGAGWGYSSDDGIHSYPALMGGFEVRTGRNIKLLSENYFFPEERFGLLSVGPRFFGERLSADLALVMPVFDGAGLFIFPVINFVYNW